VLKKIVLFLLFIALVALIYLLTVDTRPVLTAVKESEQSRQNIPSLNIPKKSIEFSVTKRLNGQIEFIGSFAKRETAVKLAEQFQKESLIYRININHALVEDRELIELIEKLLKIFIESYDEGEIIFKQHKLLISGKVSDQNISDKVESLLSYSTVNSFNNTELSKSTDIASELDALLQEDGFDHEVSDVEIGDTIKELETVVSNHPLKEKISISKPPKSSISKPVVKVAPEKKETSKQTPPPKVARDKKAVKPIITQAKKETPSKPLDIRSTKESGSVKEKVVLIEKEKQIDLQGVSEAEAYRRQLAENMPDEDIMALPSVTIVDMDIEDKIKRGEIKAETTKKPLVEKDTIHIPSNDKEIDKSIPFAILYDPKDKLDGIVLEEVVASPTQIE